MGSFIIEKPYNGHIEIFKFGGDRSDVLLAGKTARGGLRKFRATARNYL